MNQGWGRSHGPHPSDPMWCTPTSPSPSPQTPDPQDASSSPTQESRHQNCMCRSSHSPEECMHILECQQQFISIMPKPKNPKQTVMQT